MLIVVQQKFLIPENTTLKVTDDQGIEVDEDVFSELATTKEMCFIIHNDDGRTLKECLLCFVDILRGCVLTRVKLCAFQNFHLMRYPRTLLNSQTWQSLVLLQIRQNMLLSLLVVSRLKCNVIMLSAPGNIYPDTFAEAALRLNILLNIEPYTVFCDFQIWLFCSKGLLKCPPPQVWQIHCLSQAV